MGDVTKKAMNTIFRGNGTESRNLLQDDWLCGTPGDEQDRKGILPEMLAITSPYFALHKTKYPQRAHALYGYSV